MPQQRYERVRRLQPTPSDGRFAPERAPLMALLTGGLQIAAHDDDDVSPVDAHPQPLYPVPSSPPPSFHSRASSPTNASRRLLSDDPLTNDADRTLADTFDNPSDSEDSDDENGDGMDDRQRLMRGQPETLQSEETEEQTNPRQGIQRRVTQLPVFQTPAAGARSSRIYGGGQNDGVWANLSAKPQRGDDVEEKPPVCTPQLYSSSGVRILTTP